MIDPVLIRIGPLSITWYALSYVISLMKFFFDQRKPSSYINLGPTTYSHHCISNALFCEGYISIVL